MQEMSQPTTVWLIQITWLHNSSCAEWLIASKESPRSVICKDYWTLLPWPSSFTYHFHGMTSVGEGFHLAILIVELQASVMHAELWVSEICAATNVQLFKRVVNINLQTHMPTICTRYLLQRCLYHTQSDAAYSQQDPTKAITSGWHIESIDEWILINCANNSFLEYLRLWVLYTN